MSSPYDGWARLVFRRTRQDDGLVRAALGEGVDEEAAPRTRGVGDVGTRWKEPLPHDGRHGGQLDVRRERHAEPVLHQPDPDTNHHDLQRSSAAHVMCMPSPCSTRGRPARYRISAFLKMISPFLGQLLRATAARAPSPPTPGRCCSRQRSRARATVSCLWA